jgi:hypothetical protein
LVLVPASPLSFTVGLSFIVGRRGGALVPDTYLRVGRFRVYVGVWKHGLSFYGWAQGRDAGFTGRHPELVTSKGTIKLRLDDAARIPDDELRDLLRAALDG